MAPLPSWRSMAKGPICCPTSMLHRLRCAGLRVTSYGKPSAPQPQASPKNRKPVNASAQWDDYVSITRAVAGQHRGVRPGDAEQQGTVGLQGRQQFHQVAMVEGHLDGGPR